MFTLINYKVILAQSASSKDNIEQSVNFMTEYETNLWKNVIKTEIFPQCNSCEVNTEKGEHISNFFTKNSKFVVHEIYIEYWKNENKFYTCIYCDCPLTGTYGAIYENSNKLMSIKENLIPINTRKVSEDLINKFAYAIYQWKKSSFYNYELPFVIDDL